MRVVRPKLKKSDLFLKWRVYALSGVYTYYPTLTL